MTYQLRELNFNSIIIFFISIFIITNLILSLFTFFSFEQNTIKTKQEINKPTLQEVNKVILSHIGNTYKNQQMIKKVGKIALIGQKEYGINIFDLYTIIYLESRFNRTAFNRNIKSFDYGLTQQNSEYIKNRFKSSSQILRNYNIKYNLSNMYDINLNVMSAILYLHYIKDKLRKNNRYTYKRYISAYNVGITGVKTKRKKGQKYFQLFIELKHKLFASYINNNIL